MLIQCAETHTSCLTMKLVTSPNDLSPVKLPPIKYPTLEEKEQDSDSNEDILITTSINQRFQHIL